MGKVKLSKFALALCAVICGKMIPGLAGASEDEATKYHGTYITKESPPGHRSYGASCTAPTQVSEDPCAYSLIAAEFQEKGGKKVKVNWLAERTGETNSDGSIAWRIVNSIRYDENDKENFGDGCESTEYPGEFIIARGVWRWKKKPAVGNYLQPISRAWRINFQERRFQEISVRKVRCNGAVGRDGI
jgi:hypothetical protein